MKKLQEIYLENFFFLLNVFTLLWPVCLFCPLLWEDGLFCPFHFPCFFLDFQSLPLIHLSLSDSHFNCFTSEKENTRNVKIKWKKKNHTFHYKLIANALNIQSEIDAFHNEIWNIDPLLLISTWKWRKFYIYCKSYGIEQIAVMHTFTN